MDRDTLSAYCRARRALAGSSGVIIVLLATHLGEFWPFSIYPMFSRAGYPFTRSVVRELEFDEPYSTAPCAESGLPGRAFPVVTAGVAQNDVANFVSKTDRWTPDRAQALQLLFAEHARAHRLLVFAARGELTSHGVAVSYRPIVELSPAGPRLVAR